MASDKNLFFVAARTQHQNLGDALITRELLRLLGERGRVELYEARMPVTFLEAIGAAGHARHKTAGSFVWKLVASAVKRVFEKSAPRVYYILNPGGFSGRYSAKEVPRHLLLLASYVLLNIGGVRIIRLGQSIGPFAGVRTPIERWKANWTHVTTARDPLSLEYAKRIGIRRPVYFPDLAFAMPPLPGLQEAVDQRKFAVLSFRSEPQVDGYDESVVSQLSWAFAPTGLWPGLPIRMANQVTFDSPRNAELARLLKETSGGTSVAPAGDLDSLQRLYAGAEVVVSNRLHVLLLALRAGTPVFALVHPSVNVKIVGLFDAIGLPDHVIDLSNPRWPSVAPDPRHFRNRAATIFSLQSAIARTALEEILEYSHDAR